MKEYVFGANILENLTTGMYQDSKVIYREYIQNACDQIDKACTMGLLHATEGRIDIWLDEENRIVSIEDNATGICAADFESTLADIANSDKKLGEDKGFRGIGRLCGLAYCKELVFTSTAAGEDTISIMKCDAAKMRELISAHEHGKKYTASEVLHSIYHFDSHKTEDIDGHWFKVELAGINPENTDLLDFSQIKEYLSFVAPVPYQNTFIFRTEVYRHARELKYHIDEYQITLNGEPIFKKYKTNFKTSKGEDEVFDLAFKEIYDAQQNLLAWLWIGISHFKGVIAKDYTMRGLRLRKENIQLGDEDALKKLFIKEDRGHHYFIGEVFAVSKELIPNSQRDYFNENGTRLIFEQELRHYFVSELYKTYYACSTINSAFDKIDAYNKKVAEFEEKNRQKDFDGKDHFESALAEVEKARTAAEKAASSIERQKQKNAPDSVIAKVIERTESERKQRESEKPPKTAKKPPEKPPKFTPPDNKFSAYKKNERKLIFNIFRIIRSATDGGTADTIIKKIEEELK